MATQPMISADSHVNEPGDLWVERIDKTFRDRAPRVVTNPPGLKEGSYFQLEGVPLTHVAQGLAAGIKPEALPQFFETSTYKDARPGGWDPAERLKDMDVDGVAAEVLYTTLGFRQFWLSDGALQRACFRVYNDWLAEYCAYAPKQLAGLALISLYDIEAAVQELQRCAARFARCPHLVFAPEDRPIAAGLRSVWAAARRCNCPSVCTASPVWGRRAISGCAFRLTAMCAPSSSRMKCSARSRY